MISGLQRQMKEGKGMVSLIAVLKTSIKCNDPIRQHRTISLISNQRNMST